MSIKAIIIGLCALALLTAVGSAKYLYDQNQSLKTNMALLEAQNEAAIKQANKFANRPRSDNDVTSILCERARAAEGNKDKPVGRLPVRACP